MISSSFYRLRNYIIALVIANIAVAATVYSMVSTASEAGMNPLVLLLPIFAFNGSVYLFFERGWRKYPLMRFRFKPQPPTQMTVVTGSHSTTVQIGNGSKSVSWRRDDEDGFGFTM